MATDYTLNWSDDSLKSPFTLPHGTVDTTSTSLALTGRDVENWGERIQENQIRLLENFASISTAPPNPTPGQIWFNVATNFARIYYGGSWHDLGYRRISSSGAPAGPNYPGDLWYDTTTDLLKVYTNTNTWVSVCSQCPGTGGDTGGGPAPTLAIGDVYGGGTYVGSIKIGADTFYVIMAPKTGGETTLRWLNTKSLEDTFYSDIDSVANTSALLRQSSPLAQWARSLTLGGFSDWQVPSRMVLELMYRNAKPTTTANRTNTGTNSYSVPPNGSNYTSSNPAQSSLSKLQSGGAEALSPVLYWCSTGVASYSTTDSYANPDVPVYGTKTLNSYRGLPTDSSFSRTPDGSAAVTPTCADMTGNPSPENITQQNWGDGTYMLSWTCPYTVQEIVGYTSGGYSYSTTYYYPAYLRDFSNGGEQQLERDQSALVRAVRLVKVV